MNTKPQFLRWLLIFVLSVISTGVFGQNTDPTQTVCISTQNYSVIPGDPGNTFQWAVTPGASGTDWTINSPTVINTDIVWLKSGIYTVTFTETNVVTNCATVVSVQVTVIDLPTATIAYSGTPYCALGTATVTQTGTAGGTYSSTAGLSINATSGAIDLTASTPGTYLITYSFTAGACSNTATTSVTINALPATSPIRHN